MDARRDGNEPTLRETNFLSQKLSPTSICSGEKLEDQNTDNDMNNDDLTHMVSGRNKDSTGHWTLEVT